MGGSQDAMPMRLTYLLISPTFGMHQYTADLANRMALAGHVVHLVTTRRHPQGRYLPAVQIHTPVDARDSGVSLESLHWRNTALLVEAVRETTPDVVHITGPHLWNMPVLRGLRRVGIPTVHTLHDLEPHPGSPYGPILHLWNRAVCRHADHILVHAQRGRDLLIRRGLAESAVTCTPLLHLFVGSAALDSLDALAAEVSYEPFALFFGRLERYKGVEHLVTAWAMMNSGGDPEPQLVIAGPGDIGRQWAATLPPRVEVRNRLIGDEEAVDLFRRCSFLVLPYTGATQSALIPAAYYFRKPVIAAPSGALPEYVQDGRTGWLVEVQHPASFARCLASAFARPKALARAGEAGRAWYEAMRAREEEDIVRMYARLGAGHGTRR
ncbi:MAG: glycosyltransferase [Chloroflexi bacterium]|nr:glycosyltransferase [Chloroflexota bacterium]